jgi:signal transduction histidine kinase
VTARPSQPHFAPTALRPLVVAVAELLSNDPAVAAVRVEVTGDGQPVSADAELLKIVFLNLLLNGAHAMQGQGTITVSFADANGECRMVFADTGPGIPADVRDKVFVPFFTTKSRGTGLGLPTAKRIVEAHHGTISIDCPADGGTTVQIRLPVQLRPQ